MVYFVVDTEMNLKSFLIQLALLCAIVLNGLSQNRLNLLSHLPMPDVSWDVWAYHDSVTNKDYALIGSNGLTIVDITDPSNPFQVSNVTGVSEFDHKVWKNYVYTASGSGTNGTLGYIIDISDPTNPNLVDSFPSAHNLFIDDKGFMYASNPGVIIYDLNNDPTNPDSLWKGGVEGHDVTVVGDLLYDFHGRYGTNIYDVSDRSNPKLLSYINDPDLEYHHQGWTSKDGKYLYICDELAVSGAWDISVWDITNLDDPEKLGGFADNSATVHNLFVIDDWGYTSYYAAGVRVFDLSDPTDLLLEDEYDTTPDFDEEGYKGVFGIYPVLSKEILIATDRDSGLYIFSFDTARQNQIVQEQPMDMELIPSVTTDKFNVLITRGTEDLSFPYFRLEVHNVLGQILYRREILLNDIYQREISLQAYQKGTYYVTLRGLGENDKQIFSRKVIKN